ncbi:hypothetical protein EV178_001460 [Coemansia sp. RSA 1646]|nr:hypothetical protein EV178_001460 [Coemansia sp. RSA 1646]KAJ2093363.1 hypothetical protein IW138_000213 [Coemansia sp. RSA 986]
MDESSHLLLRPKADYDVEQARNRKRGGIRKWIAVGTIAVILVLLAISGRQQFVHKDLGAPQVDKPSDYGASEAEEKVRVEFFVMSRCPDAVKMEQVFSQVVDSVHSIMDVQLSFIASLDPNATTGAVCKHGEHECRGNIDELCALHHRPNLPSFWRFLGCLNNRVEDIGKDKDLALRCASAAGLDAAAFLACTSQDEGRALFKLSVENALVAGVNTSATVFIDGKKRCVEDAGWRECPGGHQPEDFIRDICAAYKGLAQPPSVCAQYPHVL